MTTIHPRPARERITLDGVRPGDILDGRTLGIPEIWRVRSARHISTAATSAAHLRVDRAPEWRAILRRSDRQAALLARHAARHGCHIASADTCSGSPRLYEIGGEWTSTWWICRGQQIVAEIVLRPGVWAPMWRRLSDLVWRPASPRRLGPIVDSLIGEREQRAAA